MSNLKFKKVKFGTLYDGRKVHLYTVSNGSMSFSAIDYGCTITSILLPAKGGKKSMFFWAVQLWKAMLLAAAVLELWLVALQTESAARLFL